MRLAAGLRPDPLRELTALPDHPAGFKGQEPQGSNWEDERGKGTDYKGAEKEKGKQRREGGNYWTRC